MFAWLTHESVRSGTGEAPAAWSEFVHDVLRNHVRFSVPSERLSGLGSGWWQEAMGRALVQFLRENRLAPSINRYLDTMHGSRLPAES